MELKDRKAPRTRHDLFQEPPSIDKSKEILRFYADNTILTTVLVYRDGSVSGKLDKFNAAQIDEIMRARYLFRQNLEESPKNDKQAT